MCDYCGCAFAGGTFFESGGKPFCSAHYHQQTGATCAGCGKAITGRSASAGDKKYHPECLQVRSFFCSKQLSRSRLLTPPTPQCAFCLNPLSGGAFATKNGKNYCKVCNSKLFA